MNEEQQVRWDRIRNFPIDAPNASFPYSTRLAQENGWTPVYAARVIEEYRKFGFLAVAAGHGVTPSKAVDEAWHLHLIYTKNYWEEFCPHALGRPLHHNPSDGSEGDDSKYEGWYENTLASYERLFGSPPPGDIWPNGAVPKKPIRRGWAFLALLGLALGGCTEPANPLDWHGPEFLQLFGVLYAVFALVAYLVREAHLGPDDGPPAADWQLHLYEQAYLNGGSKLALQTALTRLTAKGILEVDRSTRRIRALVADDQAYHPLERSLLRAATVDEGTLYATIVGNSPRSLSEMEEGLRRKGLWVAQERVIRATVWPFLLASLPLLLGLAKISVGISRERPVGFLVLGCLLGLGTSLAFLISPRRSRYGEKVLSQLQKGHGGGSVGYSHKAAADADQLAFGLALYGMVYLEGTSYSYLPTAFMPPATSYGGDGGGSSCSSSSCSSSSCGGGGGCGGGGCGGCGS